MYQFKSLKWHKQKELNGFYAEPCGLKCSYSITTNKKGQIKFALLDANYEYVENFPQICTSVEEAQEMATKHYVSLLEKFIV